MHDISVSLIGSVAFCVPNNLHILWNTIWMSIIDFWIVKSSVKDLWHDVWANSIRHILVHACAHIYTRGRLNPDMFFDPWWIKVAYQVLFLCNQSHGSIIKFSVLGILGKLLPVGQDVHGICFFLGRWFLWSKLFNEYLDWKTKLNIFVSDLFSFPFAFECFIMHNSYVILITMSICCFSQK